MRVKALLEMTARGLYCERGEFYIDPWEPVDRAVLTHGHGDHARFGSKAYLVAEAGREVARIVLGPDAQIETLPYRTTVTQRGVTVSFHPAGHVLGSTQVRVECDGDVWVMSGDYKRAPDVTCDAFEVVPCRTFITEATFALPIYRWTPPAQTFADINRWWVANQEQGRTSILFGYALGKAERILSGLDASLGPIFVHGAISRFLPAYASANVPLPPVEHATRAAVRAAGGRAIVIAPPLAAHSPWQRQFGPVSLALASGWMQIRGARRRRALDRGFVLSDHADWPNLVTTIRETSAEEVYVTHGYTSIFARWLNEQGIKATPLKTSYTGELALEEQATDPASTSDSAEPSPPSTTAQPDLFA